MSEGQIDEAVRLISTAMNIEEGNQARATFDRHFECKRLGIDDGRTYQVLLLDDIVKGISGLHHYSWGPRENVWLAWFAVDPSLHGQGLGSLLLNAVTQMARQAGYVKFFIETYSTPDFARARNFYEAQGFQPAGHVDSYLPDGGDMIVYYKDLKTNA